MERILEAQIYARPTAAKILRKYPDAVDDVLQSAAVKAITTVSQFEGRSTFNSWFMRIAINEALIFLRKNWRDCFMTSYDDLDDGVQFVLRTHEPDPFEQASFNELRLFVTDQIAAMSPIVQIGAARIFAGRGNGSTGTDRSRAHHARQALQAAVLNRFGTVPQARL